MNPNFLERKNRMQDRMLGDPGYIKKKEDLILFFKNVRKGILFFYLTFSLVSVVRCDHHAPYKPLEALVAILQLPSNPSNGTTENGPTTLGILNQTESHAADDFTFKAAVERLQLQITISKGQTPTRPYGFFNGYIVSISPDLPNGINFDTSQMRISGTSNVISPPTEYTILAEYVGSSLLEPDLTKKITLEFAPPGPENLSYNCGDVGCAVVGIPFTLIPNYSGIDFAENQITSWTLDSPPPAGISFDTTNGRISGTLNTSAAQTPFSVTASNAYGSKQVTLNLQAMNLYFRYSLFANGPAEVRELYTGENANFGIHTLRSATAVTFSLAGTLPNGLSFNTTNGTISGTPFATASQATYNVTGTNSYGSYLNAVSFRIRNGALRCYQWNANQGCPWGAPYSCDASSYCYTSLSNCQNSLPCEY
ncbi:hypothetical protein EHQ12_02355 [Leptospira gomenensis]|nr:hypothetical protein EHQ07_15130 [Leptospira gomenensis]TGK44211.1 hypothetical protein EHQ12_02355 [Leptospira gomenensis]TGK57999.1 hypothetical protein EHQ13_14640 [Leptospira gomenensis]